MSAVEKTVPLPTRVNPTVLVVGDEVLLRCAIGDHLRACGLHVLEAASAEEAVKLLTLGVEVDVVFSDVQMPGSIDGIALACWIRKEHPSIKIILTSAATELNWTSGERFPVIPKPYDHHELEHCIRRLLSDSPLEGEANGQDLGRCA